MNPHLGKPISFASLMVTPFFHRHLIYQMVKRDISGRYRGSFIGLFWSVINPILMLSVYTLVFSVVFKARWGGMVTESRSDFAVILFVGLIIHSLFAETLSRASFLIISNVNYVKKVIFPLEILSIVSVCGVLFHTIISMLVLSIAFFCFNGYLHWTLIFTPLVIMPLVFVILGVSWFLASIGVYVRDVGQTITLLMTIAMFLSPVFYPISSLPEKVRPLILINPITFIIEQARAVLIFGHYPDFYGLACYTIIALLIMWVGYVWFQKTRKGFADVL